jgi:hypothetical protein
MSVEVVEFLCTLVMFVGRGCCICFGEMRIGFVEVSFSHSPLKESGGVTSGESRLREVKYRSFHKGVIV